MSDLLKPGRFLAHVTHANAWGLSETKKGDVTIGIRFTLVSGPDTGQTVIWWGNFTDDSWKRTAESMLLVGWDGNDIEVTTTFDPSRVVELQIDHDKDLEGKTRAKASWINPIAVTTKRPVSEANRRDFSRWLVESVRREGLVADGHGSDDAG